MIKKQCAFTIFFPAEEPFVLRVPEQLKHFHPSSTIQRGEQHPTRKLQNMTSERLPTSGISGTFCDAQFSFQ